jgi:CD109 antigen
VSQTVEVPIGGTLTIDVTGRGQPVLQLVRRYNVAEAEAKAASAFKIDVNYNTTDVAVNDTITIDATVEFTPPSQVQAGMVVVDISVPTGFAPVTASLDALKSRPKLKRYDVAGRKVVFYLEDMAPGERVTLSFKAVALYPVKAQPVTSQAYSYYSPELKGESLGKAVTVGGR